MSIVANLLKQIKASSLWFIVPSIALAVGVGLTISGYTPLVFDPSLYPTQSALASELTTINAEKLESSKSKSVGGAFEGELQDGTWTGYAPCGEGNSQGWQPYYVAVTIEVKDGKVVSITSIEGSSTGEEGSTLLVWDAAENQEYLDLALYGRGDNGVKSQMDSQIAESGVVSGVDTVSGATYSCTAIYNAVVNAMKKSAGQEVGATTVQTNAGASASANVTVVAPASTGLADGEWTGKAACGKGNDGGWKPYYVSVTIKVKNGKVVKITKVEGSSTGEKGDAKLSWDAAENQKYLSWGSTGRNSDTGVTTQINSTLKAGKSISSIDTVSGATYSSVAIYNAYATAVNKAAKAGGSKDTTKQKKEKKKKKKSTKKPSKVTVDDGDVSKQALADGTWIGYADCGVGNEDDWKPYYVSLTVKVKGGKVTSVSGVAGSSTGEPGNTKLSWDASENKTYLDWAANGRTRSGKTYQGVIDQIQAAIAAGNLPKSVDAVSGATYSSQSLLQAFYAALKKSAAEAGSKIDEPDTPSGGGDEPSGSGESDDPGGSDEPSGSGESDDPSGQDEPGNLVDGTYAGHAICYDEDDSGAWEPYYIIVSIEVVNGKISSITDVYGDADGVIDPNYVYSAGQNKSYLDRAIKGYGAGRHPGVVAQINNELAKGTVPTTCDTISGATYSSISIIAAYNMAVAEAQATATDTGADTGTDTGAEEGEDS